MTAHSRHSSAGSAVVELSREAWKRLEAILYDFERAWQRGQRPSIGAGINYPGRKEGHVGRLS